MTCSKRDECGDIDTMKIVGNAMKRKIEDQDIELKQQMIMIRSLENLIEAERQTCRFASVIAVIEFLIIVLCIISMWVGGYFA